MLRVLRSILALGERPERRATPEDTTRCFGKADHRFVIDRQKLLAGHQCQGVKPILGCSVDSKPFHVVVGAGDGLIWIISAYYPNPDEWNEDYSVRRK